MEHLVLLNSISPESIANKLRLLINSRVLRETIGRGGRNFIAHYMNWGKVAQDIADLLKDVVIEHK